MKIEGGRRGEKEWESALAASLRLRFLASVGSSAGSPAPAASAAAFSCAEGTGKKEGAVGRRDKWRGRPRRRVRRCAALESGKRVRTSCSAVRQRRQRQ